MNGATAVKTKDSLDAIVEAVMLEKIEEIAEVLRESKEVMDSEEARIFMRQSSDQWKRLAPRLPRHNISERRYLYVRSELLEWLRMR